MILIILNSNIIKTGATTIIIIFNILSLFFPFNL